VGVISGDDSSRVQGLDSFDCGRRRNARCLRKLTVRCPSFRLQECQDRAIDAIDDVEPFVMNVNDVR